MTNPSPSPPNTSVHLLLRTTGPSTGIETLTAGLSCAVLELTSPLLARIHDRATQILSASSLDRSLSEMYYWDATTAFFESDLVTACEESLGLAWMETYEERGYAPLAPEIVARLAAEEFEPQRTECDQMAVSCSPNPGQSPDLGIRWVVIPKHGGIYVETSQILLVELERLAAEFSPHAQPA